MSRRSSIPRPEMLALLDKLPKRTTVPTQEEMKYIQAANEPLPEYIKSNLYWYIFMECICMQQIWMWRNKWFLIYRIN